MCIISGNHLIVPIDKEPYLQRIEASESCPLGEKNGPGIFAKGVLVIYSKKDRVLNVESNYQKSCHFFNIILYKTSDMIFGMELLSKGNKIGSVYQGRCVCVY